MEFVPVYEALAKLYGYTERDVDDLSMWNAAYLLGIGKPRTQVAGVTPEVNLPVPSTVDLAQWDPGPEEMKKRIANVQRVNREKMRRRGHDVPEPSSPVGTDVTSSALRKIGLGDISPIG